LTDFVNCHGCNFTSPPVVAGDMLTFGSTAGELARISHTHYDGCTIASAFIA
jgi:hypothetical protein